MITIDITIEIDKKIIEDKSELTKTFNSHYINIVKSTTGKHPIKLGTLASRISKKEIVTAITDKFKNHSSIISIKNEFQPAAELNIKAATVKQVNKIIRSLNAKKAVGPDSSKGCKNVSLHNRQTSNIINNTRQSFFTRAVLIDLSKVFDCIQHNLLIAKLCLWTDF